ncbi:MAG: hypothetical protein Q7S21_01390 [archaeon]|nr:hypothetical protein [archaeon]
MGLKMTKTQKDNLQRIKEVQKVINTMEELIDNLTNSSDSTIYNHKIEPTITSNGIVGAIKLRT